MFSYELYLEQRYARPEHLCLFCCLWETSTNPLLEDALDSCSLLCSWSKLLSDHAGSEGTLFSSVPAVPVLCECTVCSRGWTFLLPPEKEKRKVKGEREKEKRKGGE